LVAAGGALGGGRVARRAGRRELRAAAAVARRAGRRRL